MPGLDLEGINRSVVKLLAEVPGDAFRNGPGPQASNPEIVSPKMPRRVPV